MEVNRIISRSIAHDPVVQKIQKLRYHKHKASLEYISHSGSKYHAADYKQRRYQTHNQNQTVKSNKAFIKQIFDNKNKQNQSLIKKMLDIDRRKNQYQSNYPIFPFVSKKHKNDEEQMRRQNSILIQKIVHQRSPRSKQKIIEESRIYEKYKDNLRKFKKKMPSKEIFHPFI